MRQAIITFIATFLGAVIALFVYRYYERHEAEQERGEALLQHQETVRSGAQLDDMVIAQERAVEAIRSDVVAAAMARTALVEFYLSTGRMPSSNAEAGLPEPSKYRGRSLRSLTLGEAGHIMLEFDALSGRDGGIIEFVPDLGGTEAMGVQWHCTTRDFPQIVRALPSCDYVARDGSGESVTPELAR